MRVKWPDILISWLVLTGGVWLAAATHPGIDYANTASLLIAAALIGLLNAVLRPLLVLFTLPFVILTLGLGVLLINAAIFGLASWMAGPGFVVASFWAALWGALVVSVLSLILQAVMKPRKVRVRHVHGMGGISQPRKKKDEDVIDI